MKDHLGSFKEWCANVVFALSPEKRRILRAIHRDVHSRGLIAKEVDLHLTAVAEHSFDRYTLRMIHNHAHLRPPFPIVELLKASRLDGDPKRLALLVEDHFTIRREIDELTGDRYQRFNSYLSPESMTVYRNSKIICHYLLHNTEDYALVLPLLRDRYLWDFDELMRVLNVVKKSPTVSLSDGML